MIDIAKARKDLNKHREVLDAMDKDDPARPEYERHYLEGIKNLHELESAASELTMAWEMVQYSWNESIHFRVVFMGIVMGLSTIAFFAIRGAVLGAIGLVRIIVGG
jgi:hypothetical protein